MTPRGGIQGTAATIAAALADGGATVVELRHFGTADPLWIAEAVDAFCRAHLGAAVAAPHFYRTGVGCVAGVELADGRAVVVKAHGAPAGRVARCVAMQRHLAVAGFPCPEPLAGPVPLGETVGTAEMLLTRGAQADPQRPAVREAIAAALHRMVSLAAPHVERSGLGGAWFTNLPAAQTWPRPHSPLFDFEATTEGAAWIDELAREARARPRAGTKVVGHFDWRSEHLRFEGDEVVACFDWDSLHADLEPVVVGAAAHAFTLDGSGDVTRRVPSLDEIHAFVGDYERARGVAFTDDERRTAMASCVYSLAYSARCNHAVGMEEGAPGDFRPLLRDHGTTLLGA